MIYLDLDGVFADYRDGFRKVLGYDYHDSPAMAWPTLDQVPKLFSRLEPLPGAKAFFSALADLAKDYDENLAILTALPRVTRELYSAKQDKIDWVAKHLDPEVPVIVVPGWTYKTAYCRGPEDILIDDSSRNVDAWINANGTGIVHSDTNITLHFLRQLLDI